MTRSSVCRSLPPFRLALLLSSIGTALLTRRTTCLPVVQKDLARIEAYEPVFNAFVEPKPNALSH